MLHSQYHTLIAYLVALFEVLFYLRSIFTASIVNPSSTLSTLICPALSTTSISEVSPLLLRPTPTFLLGVLTVLLGTFIRRDCFKTLGPLFTFELTVQPNHQLVTTGFYAYVRHPSYTGAIFLVFGLALSHLTRGSWMTECGPLAWIGGETLRFAVWATWWLWVFCVVISRADAEDQQMRKVFNEEWDAYAQQVPWWFLPGLI
jgi:protein-S-isoprenylcysteine O-methyltransferase Ste14